MSYDIMYRVRNAKNELLCDLDDFFSAQQYVSKLKLGERLKIITLFFGKEEEHEITKTVSIQKVIISSGGIWNSGKKYIYKVSE